jgi:opacity protein-like surface antigen
MFKRILLVLGAATLLLLNTGYAQVSVTKVGTSSAAFLNIEIGARAVGMGGAFVGLADDPTAVYWNPAGVARLQGAGLTLMHIDWLAETNFDFGVFILPIEGFGTVAASLATLTMEDMEVRTVLQPDGTGELFTAGDLAATLTYALNLTDRFSIGFNAKYIRSSIWNESANAFAIDIGTLFTTQFNGMRLGVSLSNFGTPMRLTGRDLIILVDPAPTKDGSNDRIVSKLQTDAFDLPLVLRVGVAMDFVNTPLNRLTFAADAINPSDGDEGLNVGAEYALRNMFFLRAGYKSIFRDLSEQGLTFGLGIHRKITRATALKVDYAYADFGRLNNVHRFSVGLNF